MKNNIFFEPPSRLQVLDKLKHMVRFSDFLLLVSGDRGAGKSTLVEQLKPDLSDNTLFCCVVSSETGLEQEQLLDQLLSQLPLHDQIESDFSSRLKAFYLQLKAFRESGQKCLIIVDDAENLSANSLELLLNLHQADGSAGGAQLLLLMNSKFASKLLNSKPVKLLEGRVHHLELNKMTEEETKEYVSLCHPAAASLSAKKLTQLIQLSEGLPGRVEKLIAGDKVSSNSSGRTRAFPLPAAHMGGIGLILLGILAVSLWQFFPEESHLSEKAVSETITVPLPVPASKSTNDEVVPITQAGSVSDDNPTTQEITTVPVKEMSAAQLELERRLALQEKKLEEQQGVVEQPVQNGEEDQVSRIAEELREVVKDADSDASAEKGKEIAETPPTLKVIGKTPEQDVKEAKLEQEVVEKATPEVSQPLSAPKSSKYSVSENTILSWKSSGYTLQLLGARSKQSALDFISKQKDSEQFYYFSTIYKGAPWYVVIYGEFANRDIANSAIKKLPSELRKMRPWARSVRGVQIDIKKK